MVEENEERKVLVAKSSGREKRSQGLEVWRG